MRYAHAACTTPCVVASVAAGGDPQPRRLVPPVNQRAPPAVEQHHAVPAGLQQREGGLAQHEGRLQVGGHQELPVGLRTRKRSRRRSRNGTRWGAEATEVEAQEAACYKRSKTAGARHSSSFNGTLP